MKLKSLRRSTTTQARSFICLLVCCCVILLILTQFGLVLRLSSFAKKAPGAVVSCFTGTKNARTALPFIMNRMFGMRFITFEEYNAQPASWDIWATCSTAQKDRIPPSLAMMIDESSSSQGLVTFLPGRCPFAAKAGLWIGLEQRFGAEGAATIVPKTFVHPNIRVDRFKEFAEMHPPVNTTFISKSGHRQRGIREIEFDPQNRSKFVATVLKLSPTVIQLKLESRRYLNRRTAFRTYTWIECKSPLTATATVDWNSPAYVANESEDLIASGYTKSTEEFSTHELLLAMGIATEIKQAVVKKVSKLLIAFTPIMCKNLPIQSNVRTEELFALDWIPMEDGQDAMLLEINRFPDMDLHGKELPTMGKKDWLKLCTYLRRFPQRLVKPEHDIYYKRCLEAREESVAEML